MDRSRSHSLHFDPSRELEKIAAPPPGGGAAAWVELAGLLLLWGATTAIGAWLVLAVESGH